MRFINAVERQDFHAAAVLVRGIEVRESGPTIEQAITALTDELGVGLDEELKSAVRQILRNGKYRPAGRGKPAQEYLASVWEKQQTIDRINNAVDVNNIVSLRSGLPISAFDADKLRGDIVIRLGRADERYVFNASGQTLECRDLLVVCDQRGPIGSPVKDSQETKLFLGARAGRYVVYANAAVTPPPRLLAVAEQLATLLCGDCRAAAAEPAQLFEKSSTSQ